MEEQASETAIPPVELPKIWHRIDDGILLLMKVAVCLIGIGFTVMITAEVASRFVFNASIAQANAIARLLLVWFFMLGAGLALRQGAHIGLTTLTSALSPSKAAVVYYIAHGLILMFFLQMIWASYLSFTASVSQFEGTLLISMAWVMAAFPVGFVLLIYHQVVLLTDHIRSAPRAGKS